MHVWANKKHMEAQIAYSQAPVPPLSDRISIISDFLTEQKADDPFIHIFEDGNSVAEAMIVVTAASGRHARGLADGLLRLCPQIGQDFLGMEGYENAQWILADCNDVLIHIFQAEARALYRLEDLCAQSPCRSSTIAFRRQS